MLLLRGELSSELPRKLQSQPVSVEKLMSDVLQTAMNYRSRLKSELGKVEEFLRMAEEFSKGQNTEPRMNLTKPVEKDTASEQATVDRLKTPVRPAANA
jgi:hypothetical protein